VFGQAGRDAMRGGPGDDQLIGGSGTDSTWAGPDVDTCRSPGPHAALATNCEM